MSNQIQPFDFNGIQVRVLTDEHGNPWFLGADVCAILGTATNHIREYLDADEITNIRTTDIAQNGGKAPVFVSESGLYSLVLRSRKPEAREFKRWVTHEVLPQIRKTGGQKTSCNLIGERFGRLTVISKNGKTKWGNVTWKCACDCGKTVIIPGGHLKSGHTKSCGCLAYDMHVEQLETHGYTTGG